MKRQSNKLPRGTSGKRTATRTGVATTKTELARFQAMFDNTPNAIVLANDDAQLVDANPAACELTGRGRSDLVGLHVWEIVPVSSREETMQAWRRLMENGMASGEIAMLAADGRELDVEYRAIANVLPGLHFASIHDGSLHKQAEARHKENEALLENILDAASEAVISVDEAQRIIMFNKAAEQIFGYRAEELLGKDLSLLLPERFAELHRGQVQAFGQSEQRARRMAKRGEVVGKKSDGTEVSLEAGISKANHEGKIVYTVLLGDVSDRKRNEQALSESERRYRQMYLEAERLREYYDGIVNTMTEGLSVESTDGRIEFVNARLCDMLGYQPRELIAESYLKLFAPAEQARAAAETARREAGGTSSYESVLLAKDGREFQVLVTAAPYRRGGRFTGTIAAFADLSARKRAEVALQASQERLRLITDNMSDLVSLVDQHGVLLYVSPAFTRVLGYPEDALLGKPALNIIHGEDLDRTAAALADALERGITANTEARVRHADGHYLWMETVGKVLFDEHGRPEGAILSSRDVTDRKRAEDRIELQLKRITALRDIDMAITASLDVRVTLNVFLDHVIHQLDADAVAVLLLDSRTQELEYAATRGFRSSVIPRAPYPVGDESPGQAALDGKTVVILDARSRDLPPRLRHLESEGFVTYFAVPLVAKGQTKGVLEVFHRRPVSPSPDWMDFMHTLAGQAAIAIDNASLFDDLQKLNTDLALAYDTTLEGWSRALDLRDHETEGHTLRVTEMTLQLSRAIGMGDADLVHIRRGSLLHDIGKMGIPDAILLKRDKLTDQEMEVMRRHPVYAYELLSPIGYLRYALDIPYGHHEKWDGTGYPRRLDGDQIPLSARVFAVVDIWDALTSDRPFRPKWTDEDALEYIREQSGKHFDPRAAELFLRLKSAGTL